MRNKFIFTWPNTFQEIHTFAKYIWKNTFKDYCSFNFRQQMAVLQNQLLLNREENCPLKVCAISIRKICALCDKHNTRTYDQVTPSSCAKCWETKQNKTKIVRAKSLTRSPEVKSLQWSYFFTWGTKCWFFSNISHGWIFDILADWLQMIRRWKKGKKNMGSLKYVDEITWGKILKKNSVAWHGKILFYNSKRIKRLYPKHFNLKVIHLFVENDVITYFSFLIFEVQANVHQLAILFFKLSMGTYHHDSP